MATKAYGATAGDRPLEALNIERRQPGARDVQIEIAYCCVCHSDLHILKEQSIGRLGEADEVAAAVLWLCSPRASFIVGVGLPVDGGFTAH